MKADYNACIGKVTPFMVICLYRFGNHVMESRILAKRAVLIILRIIQKIVSDGFFNTEIPFKAKIGRGLRITHPYGIVISEFAVMGENCTIFHQVTIGMNEHKRDINNGVPKIGNNVYIGCGAKLIGGITVGDNVIIGANAVVVKDVPSNCTVVGNPAQIISK